MEFIGCPPSELPSNGSWENLAVEARFFVIDSWSVVWSIITIEPPPAGENERRVSMGMKLRASPWVLRTFLILTGARIHAYDVELFNRNDRNLSSQNVSPFHSPFGREAAVDDRGTTISSHLTWMSYMDSRCSHVDSRGWVSTPDWKPPCVVLV